LQVFPGEILASRALLADVAANYLGWPTGPRCSARKPGTFARVGRRRRVGWRLLATGESMNDPPPLRISQVADQPQQRGPAPHRRLTSRSVVETDGFARQGFPLILQKCHQHFSLIAK
jgi:hypothetical protein